MSGERIGRGPWARLFATALVPDEGSRTAERGRTLALAGEVRGLTVAEGSLGARVEERSVTIAAAPVPSRIWSVVQRSVRGKGQLEEAAAGRRQSVHLEHLMAVDWEEPLVPRANALVHMCTCDVAGLCEHVAAVAYAVADAIDRDPSLLLRFRGCVERRAQAPVADEPAPAPAAASADIWQGTPLPEPRPLRPLPVGAVLKRLGPSGIRVGGEDLADALQRAYASFAASGRG